MRTGRLLLLAPAALMASLVFVTGVAGAASRPPIRGSSYVWAQPPAWVAIGPAAERGRLTLPIPSYVWAQPPAGIAIGPAVERGWLTLPIPSYVWAQPPAGIIG